jgi:hypothetical protein
MLQSMTPRRTALAAACALATALTLATAPAHASTGLGSSSPAVIDTSGNLDVTYNYSCDGGGNGTLMAAAVENLTVGAASTATVCDGVSHSVTVPIPPTVGAWTSSGSPGTAVVTGALLDASNTTVATLPPTNETVY